jgi:hypothetical protein
MAITKGTSNRQRLVTNPETGELEWVDADSVFEVRGKTYSTAFTTPLVSTAAGCHSGQVGEFNELYHEHGIVGAYHKPNGDCVFESQHARNQVLKLRGLRDQDAGYMQHAGK